MICAAPYIEPFDQLMAGFKFKGRVEIATALSALLIRAIEQKPPASVFNLVSETAPERPDLIVPVPLHWTRLWQRGFNQAALLAHPIGKSLGIPVVDALTRNRRTRAQTLITSGSRRANVAKAFKTVCTVKGKHVALVDDVVTSGATITAASKALLDGGAKSVQVWACIRAKSRHPRAT